MKLYSGLFAAALGALAFSSANAADMYAPASFKDAPYVPVQTWSGFYVGINGGYAWAAGNSGLSGEGHIGRTYVSADPQKLDPSGGFGGGQIGYNVQHGRLVYGIEADIQGAGIEDSANVGVLNGAATAQAKSELDWFGTVRGRLGYAFDRTLVYFTGGFAFGGVKDSVTGTVPSFALAGTHSIDDTKTGYVLGGGVEHALSPAWSIKAEYQYIDLGTDTVSVDKEGIGINAGATATLNADHSYHTVRLGLNYHVAPAYEPLK
jgi:outer membrane immunogenic protein